MKEELYTIPEVAKILKIGIRTLRRYLRAVSFARSSYLETTIGSGKAIWTNSSTSTAFEFARGSGVQPKCIRGSNICREGSIESRFHSSF